MARTSSPKPPEAVTPAAGLRRTKVPAGDVGKSARVFSAAVFSEMLAVSRNTITKWIRDGMPHEGDEKAYRIDVGKAVRWLQEKAANEAKEEAGGTTLDFLPPDGGEDLDMAKTRRARADADTAESTASMKAIEEAERRGLVAPIGIMEDMVQREYSNLAAALAEVGPALELRMAGAKPDRIGKECDRLIRKAVREKLKGQVERETAPYPEVGAHEAA